MVQGFLHPLLAWIALAERLHKVPQEAIRLGLEGKPFVVTSGMGSGKSLTYGTPILHPIQTDAPERRPALA